LIKIHAAAIKDLKAILDRFLLYGQTVTSIVVSSLVPPRACHHVRSPGHRPAPPSTGAPSSVRQFSPR
jgi:hypothetical protein